jgi:hypothetical protein
MDVRRWIAIIAVLAVLAFGMVPPSPARADTTEVLIITGIAISAYVAVIVIGTSIVYGPPKWTLAPMDVDLRRDAQDPGVRVGPRCRQTATSLTLVCW